LRERSDEILSKSPPDWKRQLQKILTKGITEHLGNSEPEVTRRSDFPTVRSTTRGSLDAALTAALPHNRAGARILLDCDKFANSSSKSRDAWWRTFSTLAAAWSLPPLPLNPTVVDAVASSLKAGGYRSATNYFVRARQEHLAVTGTPVSPSTDAAIRSACRSINRGALATEYKASFHLEIFASPTGAILTSSRCDRDTTSGTAPPAKRQRSGSTTEAYIDSDLYNARLVILGTWWLTREIELAAAEIEHIEVLETQRCVRWKLPASKNDTAAKGTWRTHGCCCTDKSQLSFDWSRICPFHTMKGHLHDLASEDKDAEEENSKGTDSATASPTSRGTGHRAHRTRPLFPSTRGQFRTKESTITAIRNAVNKAINGGDNQNTDDGVSDHLGGHCLRVAGAQLLSRCGVDVYMVKLIGRWGGSSVERYIQQSPLTNMPSIASAIAKAATAANTPPDRADQIPTLTCPPQTPSATESTRNDTIKLSDLPIELQRVAGKKIKNPRSGVIHDMKGIESGPSENWRTRCGWRYANSVFERCEDESGMRCPRCFPTGDSTSSSSESSDSD
jgi:hypothetical protein